MSADQFSTVRAAVAAAGFAEDVTWSEACALPLDDVEFAEEAIFVICNSGMKNTVARKIYGRVMPAVRAGGSARSWFGHAGKCDAIDIIWARRREFYDGFLSAADKVAFCETLPWIGGITKYHLAKNFGVDVAKPDVHLQRLADRSGETVQGLCDRLSATAGLKARTVDVVLWRACAIGIIDSRSGAIRP